MSMTTILSPSHIHVSYASIHMVSSLPFVVLTKLFGRRSHLRWFMRMRRLNIICAIRIKFLLFLMLWMWHFKINDASVTFGAMVMFLFDMPLAKLKNRLSLDIPPWNSGLQHLGKFVSMFITVAAMSAGDLTSKSIRFKKEMNWSVLNKFCSWNNTLDFLGKPNTFRNLSSWISRIRLKY